MLKRFLLASVLVLMAGCNSFERSTYQSLSASKAVLDQAQQDYGERKIGQSHCAYDLINDGKAAQTVAVNAMIAYEEVKATKGNTSQAESMVVADMAALATKVASIQALISNPASCVEAAK